MSLSIFHGQERMLPSAIDAGQPNTQVSLFILSKDADLRLTQMDEVQERSVSRPRRRILLRTRA